MSPERLCSFEGCGTKHYARGWCHMHYQRWKAKGDPAIARKPSEPRRSKSVEERFWSKVEKTDTCWLWTAGTTYGYGVFGTRTRETRKNHRAHRFAYELLVGPVPDGLHLDHLCRVRHCVNPDHLEPVPPRVNTLRGISPTAFNAMKTHCKYGHEFTPENTYRVPVKPSTPNGGRGCRACAARAEREARFRRRESA